MKLFEDLKIKFEKPNWSRNPELGLIDTVLEQHPHLNTLLEEDITRGQKSCVFGRKDTSSMEQIMRAAIYKELKGIDYGDLEFRQIDSKICALFIKIDELHPNCFQMYQNYISKISTDKIDKLLFELNKLAIASGIEDLQSIRQDSTAVETNIHYPTNNSLILDCIKEAHRLLSHLKEEIPSLTCRDYPVQAKRAFFKINNTKGDKRKDLFLKQFTLLIKTTNKVSNMIKKNPNSNIKTHALIKDLNYHMVMMGIIYDMAYAKETKGKKVPNDEKGYSIYEYHTVIILKGGREAMFGHKVDIVSGRSNLVLLCKVLNGNPKDSTLFAPTLDSLIDKYGIVPRDCATIGGYALLTNQADAIGKDIVNVIFNKIVGSLQNISSSKSMETRQKKWRSGSEAVISIIKHGFNLVRCTLVGNISWLKRYGM